MTVRAASAQAHARRGRGAAHLGRPPVSASASRLLVESGGDDEPARKGMRVCVRGDPGHLAPVEACATSTGCCEGRERGRPQGVAVGPAARTCVGDARGLLVGRRGEGRGVGHDLALGQRGQRRDGLVLGRAHAGRRPARAGRHRSVGRLIALVRPPHPMLRNERNTVPSAPLTWPCCWQREVQPRARPCPGSCAAPRPRPRARCRRGGCPAAQSGGSTCPPAPTCARAWSKGRARPRARATSQQALSEASLWRGASWAGHARRGCQDSTARAPGGRPPEGVGLLDGEARQAHRQAKVGQLKVALGGVLGCNASRHARTVCSSGISARTAVGPATTSQHAPSAQPLLNSEGLTGEQQVVQFDVPVHDLREQACAATTQHSISQSPAHALLVPHKVRTHANRAQQLPARAFGAWLCR